MDLIQGHKHKNKNIGLLPESSVCIYFTDLPNE